MARNDSHPDSASRAKPSLSVVIPVYNEEGSIEGVLDAWTRELDRLEIDYEISVYDDGSSDETAQVLARAGSRLPRVRVNSHPNSGHGPTVLRGYKEARGDWIFQMDSDGEIGPEAFETLWAARSGHDLLVGYRQNRRSGAARRVITMASRLVSVALFGGGVHDANVPYRLMRRALVARFLPVLEGTFAPNLILSGLAARSGARIFETPVQHAGRKTGRVSIVGRKLWVSAARAGRETIAVALRARRERW